MDINPFPDIHRSIRQHRLVRTHLERLQQELEGRWLRRQGQPRGLHRRGGGRIVTFYRRLSAPYQIREDNILGAPISEETVWDELKAQHRASAAR